MKKGKIAIYTALSVFVLIVLSMVALPLFFGDQIIEEVRKKISKESGVDIVYSDISLSFFTNFPKLSVSVYDYKGDVQRNIADSLYIKGERASVAVNLLALLHGEVKIERFYIKSSAIFWKDGDNMAHLAGCDAWAGVSLKDSVVKFNFNIKRGVLSLRAAGGDWVKERSLLSHIRGEYNIQSGELDIERGSLQLQSFPIDFRGKFVPERVEFYFDVERASLEGLLSILPPDYDSWREGTRIKGRLDASVKIEGEYNDSLSLFPGIELSVKLNKGYIKHSLSPEPVKDMVLSAGLEIDNLNPSSLKLSVDTLSFSLAGDVSGGTFAIEGLENPKINMDAHLRVNLERLSSALGLEGYNLKGLLNVVSRVGGAFDMEQGVVPVTRLDISLDSGYVSTPFYSSPVGDLQIKGYAESRFGKLEDFKFNLDTLSFMFEGRKFVMDMQIEDFVSPKYQIEAKGVLNIDNLYKLLNIKDLDIGGEIDADFFLKGSHADLLQGRFERLLHKGRLSVADLVVKSAIYPHPFHIPQALLTFNRERAQLNDMMVLYNGKPFKLSGYLTNYIGYYLLGEALQGEFNFLSPEVVLDDLIPVSTEEEAQPAAVFPIPAGMDISLKASIAKLRYGSFEVSNLTGSVGIQDSALSVKRAAMYIAGAPFSVDMKYRPQGDSIARFDLAVKADSFDIKRAYNEIALLRELAPSASSAEGKISVDYKLNGVLGRDMYPVMKTLTGGGSLRLEDVVLKGHKVMGAVSRATGRDSINNPSLKAVVINTKIANNKMKIERTRMKIFGFRPRFEGEASLDGRLNIKFRLGLPPFGIIGIPMTIRGTADNPKVTLGRSRDSLSTEAPTAPQDQREETL